MSGYRKILIKYRTEAGLNVIPDLLKRYSDDVKMVDIKDIFNPIKESFETKIGTANNEDIINVKTMYLIRSLGETVKKRWYGHTLQCNEAIICKVVDGNDKPFPSLRMVDCENLSMPTFLEFYNDICLEEMDEVGFNELVVKERKTCIPLMEVEENFDSFVYFLLRRNKYGPSGSIARLPKII